MTDFKITKIDISSSLKREALLIDIHWECREEELYHFRELNDYSRALVIPDVEALERAWDKYDWLDDTDESNPYKLGLVKVETIQGCDSIIKLGNNTYQYKQYLCDCLVTRAAITQITEMKDEMERGFCRYGDFPDQNGAFRSGSAISDFAGLLISLDLFWD